MKFRPWVGAGFAKPNSHIFPRRLLLVGESHYEVCSAPDDWTTEVVRKHINGEDLRFFAGMFNAILGHDRQATPESRASFYNAVAFYNFIQHMLEGPKQRPTPGMWKCGEKIFPSCLDSVKPSHIVVFGFEVWENLPNERFSSRTELDREILSHLPIQYRDCERHKRSGWIGRYEHSGGTSLVMKVRHPSRGFSPAAWHPVLRWFLQLEAPGPTAR